MEEKIMAEVLLQNCLVFFSYLHTKIKVVCLAEMKTAIFTSKTEILNSNDRKVKLNQR